MVAAKFYEKTLEGYSSLLSEKKVSLSRYCKEHGVNYRGLRYWMKKQSIPLPKSVHKRQQKKGVPSASFVPVSILPSALPVNEHLPSLSVGGILKGVSISLSTGMKVSIKEINGRDMIEILHSFNPS